MVGRETPGRSRASAGYTRARSCRGNRQGAGRPQQPQGCRGGKQVGAVEVAGESQGDGQPGWASRKVSIRTRRGTALSGDLDALDDLASAKQDC